MRSDRLFDRALLIQHRRGNGLWVPIIRHLALRRYADALIEAGAIAGGNRQATAHYQSAVRLGSARAAQHLAMERFNRSDLAGYRHWLGVAARLGDADAATERLRFETRLPHLLARRIGRYRPLRRTERR